MLWLYRILFLPALLLAFPAYLRRMTRRGGYGRNFSHRFGAGCRFAPRRTGVRRIWLQAVSVGEMNAIGPLLEAFAARDDVEVYLTTTTSTGYALACERHAPLVLAVGYFPLDFWPFSARAWRKVEPDLVVLTESEFWPEHIHQARRRGVPVICVNGRLSDRTFRRMGRAPGLVRSLLRGVTRVLASSQQDGQRFQALELAGAQVKVSGNIKLDLDIPLLAEAEQQTLRRVLGLPEGLVLLGSSTWPGEERALLEALRRVRAAGVACSLILVPRHAERRGEVAAELRASEFRFHLRSTGPAGGIVDVAVGDTTGELRRFTQLADVVFVGKSLPPHDQGQTPVEAAIIGKPVLFGPGMSNFREIVAGLVMSGAARVVRDVDELGQTVVDLLRNPDERDNMRRACAAWHSASRGAIARTVAEILEMLDSARADPAVESRPLNPGSTPRDAS